MRTKGALLGVGVLVVGALMTLSTGQTIVERWNQRAAGGGWRWLVAAAAMIAAAVGWWERTQGMYRGARDRDAPATAAETWECARCRQRYPSSVARAITDPPVCGSCAAASAEDGPNA